MSEYPALRKSLVQIAGYLLLAFVVGVYGRYQWRSGFDTGADTAICVFALQMEGPSASERFEACRNTKDRNYVIEGFVPHARRSA